MQRYKKRLRLLAESLDGRLTTGPDHSLTGHMRYGTACFAGTSYNHMRCYVVVGDSARYLAIAKDYCFDILERLADQCLCHSVLGYSKPPLLQWDEYLREEDGARKLASLRLDLVHAPQLTRKKMGGNRILAEYYSGVLIIRDDLLAAGTNVFEFDAASPKISRPL